MSWEKTIRQTPTSMRKIATNLQQVANFPEQHEPKFNHIFVAVYLLKQHFICTKM